jgi:hypothetical protein
VGVSESEVLRRVKEFDCRYGRMERVLWCLSKEARTCLLRKDRREVVEAFLRKIRSWWGIRGVSRADEQATVRALLSGPWEPQWFGPVEDFGEDARDFAVRRVRELVGRIQREGGRRREWSLSSKVLHWLMPWRVPAYDALVRKALGVRSNDDHEAAYAEVVRRVFDLATYLRSKGAGWMGTLEPASPLRALDKYLWLEGYSRERDKPPQAVVVRDPERVLRDLGLGCESDG